MTDVRATCNINSALIAIDRFCDRLPGASTITNLVDIFEKFAFKCCCNTKSIIKGSYIAHISYKKSWRCIVLLVPILGNIIVAIYDLIKRRQAETYRKEFQDEQARDLGLDVKLLPKSFAEREQIIENRRQEIIDQQTEVSKQAYIKSLDEQVVNLNQTVEKFKKVINDPQEPVDIQIITHKEKINYYWGHIKLLYAYQNLNAGLLRVWKFDEDVAIVSKQKEIVELKKELYQLRQTSYHDYIQTVSIEDLKMEADEYYAESFTDNERKKIKESEGELTLETIFPKLKERVIILAKNDYEIVEMQEIISKIESIINP